MTDKIIFYPFIDFNTGLIHRRRSTSSDVHVKKKDMIKGEDTKKTEEKGEDTEKTEEKGEESQETEVARLKQTIRRTERNRLKLKAATEAIDHSCQLVQATDRLYPIELFGMRADWKQMSAVGALLASVIAAVWRASA